MPLIDLKLSKEERKEAMEPGKMEGPEYPWGLQLTLDSETLEKLGREPSDYKVGEELPIAGVARVTSISQHSSEGNSHASVGLTLVKMENYQRSESARAEAMFGSKEK